MRYVLAVVVLMSGVAVGQELRQAYPRSLKEITALTVEKAQEAVRQTRGGGS